jgi:hypothetical protein
MKKSAPAIAHCALARIGGRLQMRKIRIALVLATALLVVLFTGIARAEICVVADPTGTPLNVRERPSQRAPIIGALNNKITVLTKMSRGAWVYTVPHEAPGKSGWVWRKFIDCSPPVPKLPEGIDIAWRCDGMIIAIIEKELEGVSRGGTYLRDDIERTVWIYNPLRLPLPSTFVFKQYETAHPYSTWGAELVGGQCQEVFFGTALEDRLPEKIRNLAKIVRLEKSDEFKRCIKENPDKHQMCRDTADKKLEGRKEAERVDDRECDCDRSDKKCIRKYCKDRR